MIERADYVIDIGQKGKYGGEIISIGTPAETLASNTITAQYLNGKMKLEIHFEGNGKFMKLTGATGNNLKNVSIDLPWDN
jgi:excinuclease ABC subunit A